ncbi:uncharacterized protein LOC121876632 [Homarus americanus]|uniref:Histone-lysine N-methyltransferase 2C-like 2 n=1 Tax=Homarus americanus TaxID=6706 RepID=A0A8J5JVN2_HOMAM|nr:uncharacterized protein LOC121876632 [Homarus americanus]KAG7160104.1 histone-lysine N-methyltransferase 2C-like 2 [Homarus americanus]
MEMSEVKLRSIMPASGESVLTPVTVSSENKSTGQDIDTLDDEFLFIHNSVVQRLINMKCDDCQEKQFDSKCRKVFGLVNSISVTCRHCGKGQQINPFERGEEEYHQVHKLITQYVLNSKGGQELLGELLKIKMEKEVVADTEMDEEEHPAVEVNIKEETEDFDLANGLELSETVNALVGMLTSEDKDNKDDNDSGHSDQHITINQTSTAALSNRDQHLPELFGERFPETRMWCRAVWLKHGEKMEGMLPANWIKGDTVYWPPGVHAKKAMAERHEPTATWRRFMLVKVKYMLGSKIDKAHNYTTKLDMATPQQQHEKKNFTDYSAEKYGNGASDYEEEMEEYDDESIEERNTDQMSKPRRRSISRSRSRSPLRGMQSSKVPSFAWSPSQQHSVSQFHSRLPPNRQASKSTGDRNLDRFPLPTAEFQKRVLYLLSEVMEQIVHMSSMPSITDSGDHHIVQASSLQDLTELENSLNGRGRHQQMIHHLFSIGGLNIKDSVQKIMGRLMTNDVMAQLNMRGNRGKVAFCKMTNLYNAIIASVRKQFPDATETEVGAVMATTLRYAPDRRGGGGRRKSTESAK